MRQNKFAIAIHGGAGNYNWESFSEEKQRMYEAGLSAAIVAGRNVLSKKGTALDACNAAVVEMENNPIFNAGKGSVFTKDGHIEMDATVMCGKTMHVGAIAGIRQIKNPVLLAAAILRWEKHNFMYGEDAEQLARELGGIEFVSNDYFKTDLRKEQLAKALTTGKAFLDHNLPQDDKTEKGTVGAVALDVAGNLAAATSTGGMTAKYNGRIGDSAVIGAGTYAKSQYAAVSCTGTGEAFIRLQAASRLIHMMEFGNYSLKDAANLIIQKDLAEINGSGGLIAIDSRGNIELPFNSKGMFRAWAKGDTQAEVKTGG